MMIIGYHLGMVRTSGHRAGVERVLGDAAGPLCADEVCEALRETGIGIATVYRLLKAGVADGSLVAVPMPSGPVRYEPAGRPHHHHFECLRCRRVYDVGGCPGHLEGMLPAGFALEAHEVLLQGRCAACAGGAAA